jgi:sodium/hydrogen exchanger-like protein 6/7
MKFDNTYFFNLLLPPIILNSGYDLKTDHFFRHIGSILVFAFVGTFISTLVIGGLVYCIALTKIHGLVMSFLDCLEFGAILSSTDPVTVLAIFHQVGVDPSLYAIIFGESMLNDAVAIVLSGSISTLQKKTLTFGNAIMGVLDFFAVFTGSVLIGIAIALFTAMLLKQSKLHYFSSLESCIIALLAYSSYILSNAAEMSGIVSLLFCGMVMKHYCYENMSLRTKRTTKYMFRVLSQMSENFVFIYLGVNIFTMTDPYYPGLIIFTTVSYLFPVKLLP